MNGTCINRFASWFAYHLSNFQFRWQWDEWSISLKYENLHPKPKFIAETLGYCLRLSYHAKVLESIPQSFHRLAPAQPVPKNKFKSKSTEENIEEMDVQKDEIDVPKEEDIEELPGAKHVSSLTTALSQRCTPEEALELLNEVANSVADNKEG